MLFFLSIPSEAVERRSYLLYDGPEFYLRAVLQSGGHDWSIQEFEFHYKRPAYGLNPYTAYQKTLHYLGDREFSLNINSLDQIANLSETMWLRDFSDYDKNNSVRIVIRPEEQPGTSKINRIDLFPQTGEIIFFPELNGGFAGHVGAKYVNNQIFSKASFKAQVTYARLLRGTAARGDWKFEGSNEDFSFRADVQMPSGSRPKIQNLRVYTPGDVSFWKILRSPALWPKMAKAHLPEINIFKDDDRHDGLIDQNGNKSSVESDAQGMPSILATSPEGKEFKLSFESSGQICATYLGTRAQQVSVFKSEGN